MTNSQLLCKKYKWPTLWWRNWFLRETAALQGAFYIELLEPACCFGYSLRTTEETYSFCQHVICSILSKPNWKEWNKMWQRYWEVFLPSYFCFWYSDIYSFFACVIPDLFLLSLWVSHLPPRLLYKVSPPTFSFMILCWYLSSLHYHLLSIFSLPYSLYYLCPLLLFSHFIFCPILSHFAAEYCFYIYRLGPIVLLPAVKKTCFYNSESKGVSGTLIVRAARAKCYGFSLVFIDVITAGCSCIH